MPYFLELSKESKIPIAEIRGRTNWYTWVEKMFFLDQQISFQKLAIASAFMPWGGMQVGHVAGDVEFDVEFGHFYKDNSYQNETQELAECLL